MFSKVRRTRTLIIESGHLGSTATTLPQPVRACPNGEALPRSDLEMGQNNMKKENDGGWL
jgi:hypothetical protein